MLSKKEKKILIDINKLANKLKDLKSKKEKLDGKKLKGKELGNKIQIEKDIKNIEKQLKTYFQDYSIEYKRVLKHRLIKKANQMADDLLLLLDTYQILGFCDKDFKYFCLLHPQKYLDLKISLSKFADSIYR